MWNRWQQRRHSPNHHYEDSPILSTQGGYLLQVSVRARGRVRVRVRPTLGGGPLRVLWYTTSSFLTLTLALNLTLNPTHGVGTISLSLISTPTLTLTRRTPSMRPRCAFKPTRRPRRRSLRRR